MSAKIVYNVCYGGFGLSTIGLALYNAKRATAGLSTTPNNFEIERHDPFLVEVVEELGANANDDSSILKIKEISCEYVMSRGVGEQHLPYYHIYNHDGCETVVLETAELIRDKM